jgi:CDP-glycerol glycerophosphotransferase (TagB/SpsB family)
MLYSSKKCESHFKQWDSNTESPLPELQAVRSGTAIHAGYPRTDIVFRNINARTIGESMDFLKQVHSFTDEDDIIGYFPTFRDKEFEFSDMFDIDPLRSFLNKYDQKLLISPHKLLNIDQDVLEIERVHVAKSELDSHLFLDCIDILITDYSSIYFDYLLFDRPVVFYTPDYSVYQATRGVHPNYENVIAGPRVNDFEGLVDQLESIVNGVDKHVNQREEIRDQFFEHADGNACKRIVERLTD